MVISTFNMYFVHHRRRHHRHYTEYARTIFFFFFKWVRQSQAIKYLNKTILQTCTHIHIQAKMYDGTRFRAASRRICRDKYLDIICQFYVFVAFAAVAAAHTLHNFKFCDCINDSKFHAPTNV